MENGIMSLCSDSIKLVESIFIFTGYALLLKYRGRNIRKGVLLQAVLYYFFQKITLELSLMIAGTSQKSSIINVVVALIIGSICYKGSWDRKIVALLLYVVPALAAELGTYALLPEMDSSGMDASVVMEKYVNIIEYRSVAITLSAQLFLIFWGLIIVIWKIYIERRWIKECILYLMLPIYQMFIFIVYYSFCGEVRMENVVAGVFLFLFGIIIDVSVIYLINGIFKKLKVEREISEVQEKRQEELAYYMMVNDKLEQSRFLRHEFSNQMQVIYGLLETKDTEKVKQMLDRTRAKVEQTFGENKDQV